MDASTDVKRKGLESTGMGADIDVQLRKAGFSALLDVGEVEEEGEDARPAGEPAL